MVERFKPSPFTGKVAFAEQMTDEGAFIKMTSSVSQGTSFGKAERLSRQRQSHCPADSFSVNGEA